MVKKKDKDNDTPLKIQQDFTDKHGLFFNIYEGSKRVAVISAKKIEISKGLSHDHLAEILAVKDNFNVLMSLKSLVDTPIERLLIRLPKRIKVAMCQAFLAAHKTNVNFSPATAIITALEQEILKALPDYHSSLAKQTVQESFIEKVQKTDDKVMMERPHKEIHKIFEVLLPDDEVEQRKLKGFYTIYCKIAHAQFNKADKDVKLHYLHNYRRGNARPSMWAYATALQTLHQLGVDIFSIGVAQDTIFGIWYKAHKSLFSPVEIVNKFNIAFAPGPEVSIEFRKYVDYKVSSEVPR